MSDLGTYLQQQRLDKNLSIKDIEDKTKIRKRYIEAIEQGEYSILPGSFYTRAFIKSYAEALGVDTKKLFAQYEDELPSVPSPTVETSISRSQRKSVKQQQQRPSTPKAGRWVSRILFYVFMLLLAFLIWNAWVDYYTAPEDEPISPGTPGIGQETGEEESVQEPDPVPDVEEEIEEPQEPEVVEPTLTRMETSGNETSYEWESEYGFDDVSLQAEDGAVWFRLYDPSNQSVIDETELPRGQERSWNLSEYERIGFHIGNTKGVRIYIGDILMEIDDLVEGHRITIEHIDISEPS